MDFKEIIELKTSPIIYSQVKGQFQTLGGTKRGTERFNQRQIMLRGPFYQ